MSLLNDDVKKQLKDVFGDMKEDVNIVLFTGDDCETCDQTVDYMEDTAALSDKINLEQYDLSDAEAEDYGIDKVPAIVLTNKDHKDFGIRFYGIPAGHEINSFITGVMEVSGSGEELPAELEERIAKIDQPIDIKVFVTLSCPHCPGAVAKAHKLAISNENVTGAMIEAQTFSELSNQFNVSGVPKIVINDEYELVGNQPLDKFLDEIEKAL